MLWGAMGQIGNNFVVLRKADAVRLLWLSQFQIPQNPVGLLIQAV